jgi:hypothetical protein
MFPKRIALISAGLLIVAGLAACAPVPPAPQESAATTTPAATPGPAMPDPSTDPPVAHGTRR